MDKVGCGGAGVDVLKCLRSKKPDELFMFNRDDWPQNKTLPPLAPIMPFGCVCCGA